MSLRPVSAALTLTRRWQNPSNHDHLVCKFHTCTPELLNEAIEGALEVPNTPWWWAHCFSVASLLMCGQRLMAGQEEV